MPARLIEIAELQPTDTLRQEAVSYLSELSLIEIESRHGMPQVWETEKGLLISDGNQRIATMAKRGEIHAKVDYCNLGKVPAAESYFLDTITKRAEQLRNQGIYSPGDLWQA